MEQSSSSPAAPFFPAGKKELLFALILAPFSWLLCNSALFAGLHLGFAIFSALALLLAAGYLLWHGHKLTLYSGALLVMSLILCGSFARSDDSFVKFVIFLFLILSANLSLCLLSGQNRRHPGAASTVLDAPRTVFALALGQFPTALRGLGWGLQSSRAGKQGSAVALGMVVALPLLALLVTLLIRADAAFDSLWQQLPQWNFPQILTSFLLGSLLWIYFYSRGAALNHNPKAQPASPWRGRVQPLTVNTVLVLVCLIYGVYLASQLAYFSGGFSGILPQGYTLSQYARRGFFEMAWLCGINLMIMALGVGLVKKESLAPKITRLLCLFVGLVTVFFVVCASAKMFLYIDAYGLTRLRLLTQVIIFFLGFATIFLCIWLFFPGFGYMKALILAALILGAATAWADVDTVVARYNVTAYQSGKLETVDVWYLGELGNGAAPYIARLTTDSDRKVAWRAQDLLENTYFDPPKDFRYWNYVNHLAKEHYILPEDSPFQEGAR